MIRREAFESLFEEFDNKLQLAKAKLQVDFPDSKIDIQDVHRKFHYELYTFKDRLLKT